MHRRTPVQDESHYTYFKLLHVNVVPAFMVTELRSRKFCRFFFPPLQQCHEEISFGDGSSTSSDNSVAVSLLLVLHPTVMSAVFVFPNISHLFLITFELKLQQEVEQLTEAADCTQKSRLLHYCSVFALDIFIKPFKMIMI